MIRINLLPTKAARKKETVYQQLVVGVVALALAAAAAWFWNRGVDQQIAAEKQSIKELDQKIRQLQSVIAKVDDFKKKKRDLNKKIDTIRQLNANRSGPVKMLEEFTYVIPRKSWITTFREGGKQLTLQGVAMDGPTVSDFVDSLRASKFFRDVQLIQVTQVQQGGQKLQRYSINCRVNYIPGGGA